MIEIRAVEYRTPFSPPHLFPFDAAFQSPEEKTGRYLTAPPASRTGESGRFGGDQLRRRTTAVTPFPNFPCKESECDVFSGFRPRQTWEIHQYKFRKQKS